MQCAEDFPFFHAVLLISNLLLSLDSAAIADPCGEPRLSANQQVDGTMKRRENLRNGEECSETPRARSRIGAGRSMAWTRPQYCQAEVKFLSFFQTPCAILGLKKDLLLLTFAGQGPEPVLKADRRSHLFRFMWGILNIEQGRLPIGQTWVCGSIAGRCGPFTS
jgi:hypothetical protein